MTVAVDAVVVCNTCHQPMRECECTRAPYVEGDPIVALYSGELNVGGATLRCHVLNNGARVFDADDVEAFFS